MKAEIGFPSISMESRPVGLKILITTATTTLLHHHYSNSNSNSNSNSKPIFIFQRNQIPSSFSTPAACFLKSCFLCHSLLSIKKDVYMYRGDQGFCSEECRSRQIYIDDMKQLEISTDKLRRQFRCRTRRRQSNSVSMRITSPIFL